ncbi:MAG: esterase-like activity of phytase family protein, partial [Kiritimatiellae bacterium]|nr:esterase-like activity of phytase family protein [Kiritimatiellia bacterium]
MQKTTAAAIAAAFSSILLFAPPSRAALSIAAGSEVTRATTTDGIELSGITWAGGDTYYAINDSNATNKLYKLSMPRNSSGNVSSCSLVSSVTLSGYTDLEGCAYDPASGNVWVSTEGTAGIHEFDPSTGRKIRSVTLPAVYSKMRGNFKLEALTISGDGLVMWTANEEALEVDGSISTNYPSRLEGGTVVRLLKLTRASVRDNFAPAAQYAYKTYGLRTQWAYGKKQRSGVSGLCALPDGRLLVLERECSGVTSESDTSSAWSGGLSTSFMMAVCLADVSGADDVSTLPALEGATYKAATKTLLTGSA